MNYVYCLEIDLFHKMNNTCIASAIIYYNSCFPFSVCFYNLGFEFYFLTRFGFNIFNTNIHRERSGIRPSQGKFNIKYIDKFSPMAEGELVLGYNGRSNE